MRGSYTRYLYGCISYLLPDTADVQAEGRTCKLFAKSNTVILA